MNTKSFSHFADMQTEFCQDNTDTCGLAEICRDERFEKDFAEVFSGAEMPEQDTSNGASNFLDRMMMEIRSERD